MASAPDRGVVTTWLLDELDTNGHLAGDIEAPPGAGWQEEMNDAGAKFIPYLTTVPQNSSRATGSLGDPSMDWDLPYTLNIYGVNRRQVEDLADDVRAHLLEIKKIPLTMRDGVVWKLTTIECRTIGGVGYTTAVTPTAFSQTDSYTMTLSRSLT
jgi:hypothetical protein